MSVGLAVLAVIAGVLSILSPCVLPLVPVYVGVISAHAPTDGGRSLLHNAALFIGGFTVVFVALGAVASAVGQVLRGRLDVLTQLAGAVMVAMGVGLLAGRWLRMRPFTTFAGRTPAVRTAGGVAVLGGAVAVGWTPCIGPILASVLALSASTSTVYWGALLLALYSIGLGVPLLAIASGVDRSRRLLGVVRRRSRGIEQASGALLLTVGVGYMTGWWSTLFVGLQGWLSRTGWPPL